MTTWRDRLMDPMAKRQGICELAQYHTDHLGTPPKEPGNGHGYDDCQGIAESLAMDGTPGPTTGRATRAPRRRKAGKDGT